MICTPQAPSKTRNTHSKQQRFKDHKIRHTRPSSQPTKKDPFTIPHQQLTANHGTQKNHKQQQIWCRFTIYAWTTYCHPWATFWRDDSQWPKWYKLLRAYLQARGWLTTFDHPLGPGTLHCPTKDFDTDINSLIYQKLQAKCFEGTASTYVRMAAEFDGHGAGAHLKKRYNNSSPQQLESYILLANMKLWGAVVVSFLKVSSGTDTRQAHLCPYTLTNMKQF